MPGADASSYLGGFRSGMELVGQGVEAYDRAKEWQEKLKAKAVEHEDAAKALKTEADHYSDKLKLEQGAEGQKQKNYESEAGLRKAQREVYEAEAKNLMMGLPKEGLHAKSGSSDPIFNSKKERLENARKALDADMHEKAVAGKPLQPEYLTGKEYHEALFDYQQYEKGLEHSNTAHPAQKFNQAAGISPDKSSQLGPKLRTFVNKKTGERITEKYPGEYNP